MEAEFNEAASKHSQRADNTHGHEDTEQNVVQHHGNKLPLLTGLVREQGEEMNLTAKNTHRNLHTIHAQPLTAPVALKLKIPPQSHCKLDR